MPWSLPPDMKRFKEITSSLPDGANPGSFNVVIMGRKTWDSLPPKSKPLAGRINIVISSNAELQLPAGTLLAADFESAVKQARQIPFHHQIFVIGGQSIYAAALASGQLDYISTTRVDIFSRADTYVIYFISCFSSYLHVLAGTCHASTLPCSPSASLLS